MFNREGNACPIHLPPECSSRQRLASVAGVFTGQVQNSLLGPDLRAVSHPHLPIQYARHEGDVFAPKPNPTLFKQIDYGSYVVGPACDPDANQAPSCVEPELLVRDDRGRPELLGEMAGSKLVSAIEALLISQRFVGLAVEGRFMVPAQRLGLLAPDVPLVGLHLAEPPLRARVP